MKVTSDNGENYLLCKVEYSKFGGDTIFPYVKDYYKIEYEEPEFIYDVAGYTESLSQFKSRDALIKELHCAILALQLYDEKVKNERKANK